MVVKYPISLSVSEPNNNIGLLKIRQADEETQTLIVDVLEHGIPKTYKGLQVFFCAKLGQTEGLGIVEQKLLEEEMTDPKNGKLEYTFRAQDWQVLGRQTAYFSFRKMSDDHEWVQQFTTRDFIYEVTKNVFSDGSKQIISDGSTYIWTIEDLIRLFNEYIASGKSDWEEFVNQNKEIIESVDPGGMVLKELIEARKPEQTGQLFPTVGKRLDFEGKTPYIKDVNKSLLTDNVNKFNYQMVELPLKDQYGSNLKIKQAFFDPSEKKTVREFVSDKGNITLAINAGMGSSTNLMGPFIKDGTSMNAEENQADDFMWTLAWDEDNNWKYYEANTDPQTIISEGYKNAFTALTPIVWDGVTHEEGIRLYQEKYPDKMPQQILCQREDKSIFTISIDGRNILGSAGSSAQISAELALQKDAYNAFMLDGGGSVQTILYNQQINHNHDEAGHVERKLMHMLYWDIDDVYTDVQANDSRVLQNVSETTRKALKTEVDVYRLMNGYSQTSHKFLDSTQDILQLAPGVYEGTDVVNGINDGALYLYEVLTSEINAQLKIIFAYRMYDGQIFFRTVNNKDNPATSGSQGWRTTKRTELLFSGNATINAPAIALAKNMFKFNYIDIEYTYTSNAHMVQRFRVVKGETLSIRVRGADVGDTGGYNYRAELTVNNSGDSLSFSSSKVLFIPNNANNPSIDTGSFIAIKRIYGVYDDFGGGFIG